MIAELTNHLWQSTLFGAAAALVAAALRQNRAAVRHWVWVTASLKFLVPFSLLMSLGSQLAPAPVIEIAPPDLPAVSVAIDQIARRHCAVIVLHECLGERGQRMIQLVVQPVGHALEQVGLLVVQPGRHGSPSDRQACRIGAGRAFTTKFSSAYSTPGSATANRPPTLRRGASFRGRSGFRVSLYSRLC